MCICRNNQIKTNFMVCLLLGIDLFPVPEDPRCCLCAGGFVSHYCGNFLNRNISIDTLYLPPFHRAGSPADSWRPHAERYMQQLLSTVQLLFVCDSGKLHLWGFFFFFCHLHGESVKQTSWHFESASWCWIWLFKLHQNCITLHKWFLKSAVTRQNRSKHLTVP